MEETTTNLNTEVKMLTDKSKQDFLKWVYSEYDFTEKQFEDIYPTNLKESLIMEWLDSVGIYIEVGAICRNWDVQYDYNIQENNTLNGMNGHTFPDRQSATKAAIEQANKIYNER